MPRSVALGHSGQADFQQGSCPVTSCWQPLHTTADTFRDKNRASHSQVLTEEPPKGSTSRKRKLNPEGRTEMEEGMVSKLVNK